jgi:hypothetical protein
MKLVIPNKDIVDVDESSMKGSKEKIHLIRLCFNNPTESKIHQTLKLYPDTNRYVVFDNIKLYNSVLKNTSKKYYIENSEKDIDLISFLRKNNKVLFNFLNFNSYIVDMIFEYMFDDLLRNVEVIALNKVMLEKKNDILVNWRGHVILY